MTQAGLQAQVTRRMMEAVIQEAYEVAHAEGIELEPTTWQEYRKDLFERLIPATAAHHPSMLQESLGNLLRPVGSNPSEGSHGGSR